MSKNLLKNIRDFLIFDWKTKHGEIKYWKITFYITLVLYLLIELSFNSYIIRVSDAYVKLDEYFVNGYDFDDQKNRMFKIEESWTFGIFDAASLYGNITKDKIYHVNTFGIRLSIPPFISSFPDIISVEEIVVK